MKKIIFTLILLLSVTQLNAVDTLRSHNKIQPHEEPHWYDKVFNFFGQKPVDTRNRDVIIINKDRSITFNGDELILMNSIESWVKVMGKQTRNGKYGSFIWDNYGISLSVKNKKHVKQITINFLSYYETFPNYEVRKMNYKEGGVPESYFKGVIQIEDGYLAREVLREEFKKSEVWKKFKKSAFPNSYSSTYEDELAIQFNVVKFTPTGKMKRVTIYSSL